MSARPLLRLVPPPVHGPYYAGYLDGQADAKRDTLESIAFGFCVGVIVTAIPLMVIL